MISYLLLVKLSLGCQAFRLEMKAARTKERYQEDIHEISPRYYRKLFFENLVNLSRQHKFVDLQEAAAGT